MRTSTQKYVTLILVDLQEVFRMDCLGERIKRKGNMIPCYGKHSDKSTEILTVWIIVMGDV